MKRWKVVFVIFPAFAISGCVSWLNPSACLPYAPVAGRIVEPVVQRSPGQVTIVVAKERKARLDKSGQAISSNDCRFDSTVNSVLARYGISKVLSAQDSPESSHDYSIDAAFFLIFPESADTLTIARELAQVPFIIQVNQSPMFMPG